MKNILKKEWLLWLFLALPFIYTAIIWNSLPDKVPTHWDMNNHVNGYSSKAFAGFFAPCFNVGLYLFFCGLFWALPRIDPRKASYENMGDTLYKIRAGVTIFMTLMFLFIMNSMLTQNPVIATKAIAVLMMLLFIVLGNYMRTLRPNYFVGIRTPWTIDNPEVWIRTHDVGGK
ncbi:MAG TPA: DUF1648 domain-containing protein, partial [Candidatus Kapabacteria bacterium]|nr:DUF1648 domain-containing protein [Candidatus Kapabacteria bacterium]